MPKIVLSDLTKTFQTREGCVAALDRVSLSVRDREFLVITGPSGSGKTTLLRLVAGLEPPTSGTIDFQSPEPVPNLAMVFQNQALLPHLNVSENIGLGLRLGGESRRETTRAVQEIAQRIGIEHRLKHSIAKLSGGERQKVALSRALIREPSVLLCDEPLSSIGLEERLELRDLLRQLHQERALTTLYVTHDQTEVMALGQRVMVLDQGRLQVVAPPIALYDRPANLFVARTLGSSPPNLISGAIDECGLPVTPEILRTGFSSGDRFEAGGPAASGKREVVFMIRPHHILLQESGSAGVRGVIEDIEVLGDFMLVHLQMGQIRLVAKTPRREDFRIGLPVSIHFQAGQIHAFDARTEQRIEQFTSSRTVQEIPIFK